MINIKENKPKKNKIAVFLAWTGLVIITIFLFAMAYGLINKDGKLIIVSIFALAFISILYWIGIGFYKRIVKRDEEQYKEETRKDMNDLARMNTKQI